MTVAMCFNCPANRSTEASSEVIDCGAWLTITGGCIREEVSRVLDYPWDEVHEEAERLEHYISERLEDRIAAKLGDPDTDPHGHSIPQRNGALSLRDEVSLTNWACHTPAVVSSVSDRDAGVGR